MVESLWEENERLTQELARLKHIHASSPYEPSSASSWSVIHGQVESKGDGDRRVRGRTECRTPRHDGPSTGGMKINRFTPGGTQVPDGPPPDDEGKVVPAPPPLPPLPPMDTPMKTGYDDYERVEGDLKRGRLGDAQWVPKQQGAPPPHEARTFWMERELQALQTALMNQPGNSGFWDSSYWSQPWIAPGVRDETMGRDVVDRSTSYRRDERTAGDAFGEPPHDGRAQHGSGGDLCHDAGVCPDDRAVHAPARDGVSQHDRAVHAPARDGVSQHDRAVHAPARDGVSQHDRAVHAPARDGVSQHDRATHAPARDGVSQHSRAGAADHGGVYNFGRAFERCSSDEVRLHDRARKMDDGARDQLPPGDRAATMAATGELTAQALRQAAQELEARDRLRQATESRKPYSEAVDQFKRTPGGYGFGYDDAASPLDPKSPFWIPPPGGGHDITVVRDGPDDRPVVAWEGGSGGTRIELPALPADSSPLGLGDWLTVITPLVRDVSQVSAIWWELTKGHALALYKKWKQSTRLERVAISPELPPELREARFQRTEQRGTSLLLRALPEEQQQTLIAAREMCSTAILYRLLVRFQPGGSGEKALLLQQLTRLDDAKDMVELTSSLRTWRRHFQRALEVGAVVPDGTLLLQSMETAVQQIAAKDSQVSFRLAQARSQIGVDEYPNQENVWKLSQCILAEAETLSLLSSSATSTPVPSTPIKVKQMDATAPTTPSTETPSAGKPRTTPGDTPCKWFRSDNGCRAGSRCKFQHSWEGVNDKSERCWICGSKQHRKADCAVRAQQPPKGDPGSGSGGGGTGRGRGGDGGKDGKDGRPGGDKDGRGAGGRGNGKGGKTDAGSTNASSSATTKATETPKVNEMSASEDAGTGQATVTTPEKSGKPGAGDLLMEATNLLRSLRMPATMKVMKATSCGQGKDHVLLDSGATHGLRPARTLTEWEKATPATVTLADGATSSLRLKWGTRILLSEPAPADGSSSWIIPMGGLASTQYRLDWTEGGCRLYDPRGQEVPVELQGGCPVIAMEAGRALLDEMEKHQLGQTHRIMMIKALVTNVEAVNPDCMTLDMALLVKLKEVFPELPEAVMERVVPRYDEATMASPGDKLPWNRRKRRRLQRVKNIVLHFYSGERGYQWEKMLNTKDTEALCLDLLAPTPSNMLSPQVFWYVMGLATSGRVRVILGGPPCRTVSALRYQGDSGPGVLRTDEYPYGRPDLEPRDAELVLQDTTLWVHEDIEKHRYFSMWHTAEWRAFQDRYNVSLVHFDQCTMGHKIKKPTTLGVVMDELATLDGMRGNPEGGNDNTGRSQMSMKERCAQSKKWAAWAPGLKAAIAEGVVRYLRRLPTCASPRGAHLRPLSATILSQWKEHYLHNHHPSRRDCVHCVRAAARSRPHRRVEHAEAYTLSMDLTGKLDIGKDQENETVHYLLVAVYTFPTTRDGKSLVPLPGQPEEDHPLPPLDEEVAGGGEMPGGIPGEDVAAGHDVDAAGHAVDADVAGGDDIFNEEMEVDEEPTGADAIRVEAMETALSTWEKLIQERGRIARLGDGQNRATAGALIMISSLMVAEAQEVPEPDGDLWWAGAMILMALGVVYVGQLTMHGTQACLRRLRARDADQADESDDEAETDDSTFRVVDEHSDEEISSKPIGKSARSGSATSSSATKPTAERRESTAHSVSARSGSTKLSTTSQTAVRQSGSGTNKMASSSPMTSQSGFATSSMPSPRFSTSQSGSAGSMAPSSLNTSSPSGMPQQSTTSMSSAGLSGSAGSMATSSMSMPTQSGMRYRSHEQQPSTETERAMNDQVFGTSTAVPSTRVDPRNSKNPWNEFQKANKGKGWCPTHMAKMYHEQKRKMP
eukprot:Skav212847  [mRNA]  locus=scaffold325:150528:159063:- [translate_table: standard]